MKAAIDQFDLNLARARMLSGIADSLAALVTTAVDVTDIYRASLVLGVSALDHFVHEFVRLGMIEVNRGNRTATDANLSFRVPLSAARDGIADPKRDDWLDETIRAAHSWQSFQHPDKIADAIRLVSSAKLWEGVAQVIGSDTKAVKARLTAIIVRRNQIAHEADIDPTSPSSRWPIDSGLVNDALDYIDRLAKSIYAVAA
jgi:RiboL-PSP-HEPN